MMTVFVQNNIKFYMFRKIFGLMLLTVFLFVPAVSLAGGSTNSTIPSLNPLCWQKSECAEIGGAFVASNGNCIGGTDEAQWGKCLPAGKVTTSIAIGGTNTFNHMGEYILTVYNYAVAIVGILAVAVIIVGGLQWLTSGGSAEIITQSKKRIGGALIGLVLAYTSFFILGNINPALVNLRMPQVWALKTSEVMMTYCRDLSPSTKLAMVGFSKTPVSEADLKGKSYKLSVEDYLKNDKIDTSKDKLYCNTKFFVSGGGVATCEGHYCPEKVGYGQLCLENYEATDKNNIDFSCQWGTIAGVISNPKGVLTDNTWGSPPLNTLGVIGTMGPTEWVKTIPYGKILLRVVEGVFVSENGYGNIVTVCNNGLTTNITLRGYLSGDTKDLGDGRQSFYFVYPNKYISESTKKCDEHGGLKGYALVLSMNSGGASGESHVIGKGGKDLGDYFQAHSGAAAIPGFFIAYNSKMSANYLFSYEDLSKGVILKINANDIHKMDLDQIKYSGWGGALIYDANFTASENQKHKKAYGNLIGNQF